MDPPISTDEVKTNFCHTRQYNVTNPSWPRETILLLKYEEQTSTDVETITEGVDSLPSTSNASRPAMMNPSPSRPTWKRFDNYPGEYAALQNPAVHAEKKMIDELDKTMARWQPCRRDENPIRKIKLDIYLSYSPCNQVDTKGTAHYCSNQLVDFKKRVEAKGVEVEMNIKIANFYKIYAKENKSGLCKLLSIAINLEVFRGIDDWENFLKEIGFLKVNETIREKWNDVDEYFDEGRTARESEDKKILEDLQGLQ